MADVPAQVAPLEDADPARIGGYELVGRLGAGGMGTVYLGRGGDGRLVAVKAIRREFARDPEFRARFLREAQAARRVARFCTAEVLDVDTDGAEPYLVTEFIDGPTLADHVRRGGPLPPPELERLAVAVASALTAVHSANLIHRDLKPGNILLSSSGARVIDFGIARALETASLHTREGGILGTPAFMCPEQALGRPLTPAADIYAWGGVILFAATGRMPYGDAATPVILFRVVYEEPDLTGLDPALLPLVRQAMSKDPAARPTAAALLLRLAEGGHRVVPPPSLPPPPLTPSLPPSATGTTWTPAAAGSTTAPAWWSRRPVVALLVTLGSLALLAAAVTTTLLLDPFGRREGGPPAGGGGGGPVTAGPGGPTADPGRGPAEAVTLADYREQDADEIATRLERAGLTVQRVPRASGVGQRGRVLGTEPAAGTRVERGGTVLLQVGDGSLAEARGWRVFKRYDGGPINNSPIFVVDPGGAERQIGTGDSPALSPDAGRVAYSGVDGEIISVRPDGSDPRQITDEPDGSSDSPVFSPDGRTLAYTRNTGGVFTVNADGSGRRLLADLTDAYDLSWSQPDTIVLRRGGDQALYTLSVGGGVVRKLTGSPVPGAGPVEPAWSPDGSMIAFGLSSGGIYLVKPDGSGLRQVAGPGSWHPTWSPQGALVYVRDAGHGDFFAASGPVWVMNPDRTGERELDQRPASGPVHWATSP
ncbi:protein kinase domain-containing protein [Parafrankia sp. FMc2]|uniref:protein kinase domain-containing protein n=1 Tax=Parafrankia sp. FMc2 TaxID=3233196 RepID=UPI0034D58F6E